LRGRQRGRGGEVKCYAGGKTRNMSWECPEKKKYGGGEDHISEAHKRNVEEEKIEEGMSIMMSKFLIKPEEEAKEQFREIVCSRLLARPRIGYVK
jgi:hypothetical protein